MCPPDLQVQMDAVKVSFAAAAAAHKLPEKSLFILSIT